MNAVESMYMLCVARNQVQLQMAATCHMQQLGGPDGVLWQVRTCPAKTKAVPSLCAQKRSFSHLYRDC